MNTSMENGSAENTFEEEKKGFSELLTGMSDQANSLTGMVNKLNDELKAEKKQSIGEAVSSEAIRQRAPTSGRFPTSLSNFRCGLWKCPEFEFIFA